MAKLTDKQCAALQMLAASARGYSLATMAARGFAPEMLHDLVRTGCTTVHRTAFGAGMSKSVKRLPT
jgi:predicted amidohydrolase YtcJ